MLDPADNWTRVTVESYPLVYAGFEFLRGVHQEAYNVAPEHSHCLSGTELLLKGLSEKDRLDLYRGEYDPVIISLVVINASDMFADFVYDWRRHMKRRRAR